MRVLHLAGAHGGPPITKSKEEDSDNGQLADHKSQSESDAKANNTSLLSDSNKKS